MTCSSSSLSLSSSSTPPHLLPPPPSPLSPSSLDALFVVTPLSEKLKAVFMELVDSGRRRRPHNSTGG